MKSSYKLASQHKRQRLALLGNPVFRAFQTQQKSQHEAEFQDQLVTTRTKLFMAEDGEDATELLASLAVVIGTTCDAGAVQFGRENTPWVRQLHGALRTIQVMCLEGYKWQSQHALALNRAVILATDNTDGIDTDIFTQAWFDSNAFAGQILSHQVKPDSILTEQREAIQ